MERQSEGIEGDDVTGSAGTEVSGNGAALEEAARLAREIQEAMSRLPDTVTRSVSDRTAASILQSVGPLISHLEGRLESVETALVEQEEIQKSFLQTNVGALNMRLDVLERRLDLILRTVSEPRANDTEHFLDALNARFNAIVMLIERLERRFRMIEDVLVELDQRTQGRIDQLEEHLTAPEVSGGEAGRRGWFGMTGGQAVKRANGAAPSEPSPVPPLSVAARRDIIDGDSTHVEPGGGRRPGDTSVMPTRRP